MPGLGLEDFSRLIYHFTWRGPLPNTKEDPYRCFLGTVTSKYELTRKSMLVRAVGVRSIAKAASDRVITAITVDAGNDVCITFINYFNPLDFYMLLPPIHCSDTSCGFDWYCSLPRQEL